MLSLPFIVLAGLRTAFILYKYKFGFLEGGK